MKKPIAISAAVILALCTVGKCYGWGRLGHRTIAEIAERHLTPKAKAEIERYTDGTPLAAYAVFMDSVANHPKYKKPFHGWHASIADVDCSSPAIVRNRYRDGRDGVTAMEDFRKRMARRDELQLSDSTVMCAIKCIVHIVGDFHCPAHVRYVDNANEGAIPVKFYGKQTFLHRVWDTFAIMHAHKGWTYKQYADYLDTYSPAEIKKCTAGWAQEWFEDGARDVRESIYWVGEDENLEDEFQAKAVPLAERQMRKAAYRLAKALNTIFGK